MSGSLPEWKMEYNRGGDFWQNRFHGCFMLRCPLVFCLALKFYNVNLSGGGFWSGSIDLEDSSELCVLARADTRAAVHSTTFQGFNNNHENSLISVSPVSLSLSLFLH